VQKLLEQFLMKREVNDDEIYCHLIILLNKLELLYEKVWFFNDGSASD
jgi:hypothetical protein